MYMHENKWVDGIAWVNNGGEREQTNFQDTVINSYKKRWCC